MPEATRKPREWTIKDIPAAGEMEAYLTRIRDVKSAFPNIAGFPELPEDMSRLTFEAANDIERVLLLVYGFLVDLEKSRVYSGELQSGGF